MSEGNRRREVVSFAVGALGGAIVAVTVSLVSGSVVTAETADDMVRNARVNVLARVCANEARAAWAGTVPDHVAGPRNWREREEAAMGFAPIASDMATPDPAVISRCAGLIQDMADS